MRKSILVLFTVVASTLFVTAGLTLNTVVFSCAGCRMDPECGDTCGGACTDPPGCTLVRQDLTIDYCDVDTAQSIVTRFFDCDGDGGPDCRWDYVGAGESSPGSCPP